jgi:hypothetical protein
MTKLGQQWADLRYDHAVASLWQSIRSGEIT